MNQEQAKQLFNAGGFFILPLDKKGTEFGIDGSLWAIQQDSFAGVKFLPPGLHLFVYSAPPSAATLEAEGLPSTSAGASLPSSTSSTPFGEGITIRHGLFRFTQPKEVVVRRYDSGSEAVHDGLESGEEKIEYDPDTAITKRLKSTTGISVATSPSLVTASSAGVEEVIISPEYLKTLDPKLAPYPFEKQAEWKRLTSMITSHTLNTVLGTDYNGDHRCDSLMSSLADEFEGSSSSTQQGKQRSQWGKEREINEIDEMDRANDLNKREDGKGADMARGRETCMRFANFDLKRSWRAGAHGEEITRDSRDKSWLLKDVLENQLADSVRELLSQMQLAFVIFTQLQNFSALDSYKAYLSLLCRCTSTFLPSSTGLPPSRSIALYSKLLLQVILPHIEHLRLEFFDQDLPGLETFLQAELGHLRMSLRVAYRHYYQGNTYSGHLAAPQTIDEEDVQQSLAISFKQLCQAWDQLRVAAESRFGWQLGRLEPDDVTMLRRQKGRLEYNLLAQADDEDEYIEEGDDAPVVVEL